MMQQVTVNLPSNVYQQIAQRAERNQQSVEQTLSDAVTTLFDEQWAGVSAEITHEASQLQFLDNDHLWRVAQMQLTDAQSDQMQQLLEKRQAGGLTPSDQETVNHLQKQGQRLMLLRAEAAQLLATRGQDVSSLNRAA